MTPNEMLSMIAQLRRQRDEAKADAARIADILSGLELRSTEELARLEQERNEALAQVKELIYISERAIALAEIDFENDKFGVVSELRSDLGKIKKSKAYKLIFYRVCLLGFYFPKVFPYILRAMAFNLNYSKCLKINFLKM